MNLLYFAILFILSKNSNKKIAKKKNIDLNKQKEFRIVNIKIFEIERWQSSKPLFLTIKLSQFQKKKIKMFFFL
jgi:hypothetical protein